MTIELEQKAEAPAELSYKLKVWLAADPLCAWSSAAVSSLLEASVCLRARSILLDVQILPLELEPSLPLWPLEVPRGKIHRRLSRDLSLHQEPSSGASEQSCELSCNLDGSGEGNVSNSFDVLRLVHFAWKRGKSFGLFQELVRLCHFCNTNISDPHVLQEAADSVGLDLDVKQYLDSGEDAAELRANMEFLQSASLSSIPTLVFGENFRTLVGSQPPHSIEAAAVRAVEESRQQLEKFKQADPASIRRVVLRASDASRSYGIYRHILEDAEDAEGSNPPSVRLTIPGSARRSELCIETFDEAADGSLPAEPLQLGFFVPTVAQLEGLAARLCESGMQAVSDERTPFRVQVQLRDPDGNTVALDTSPPLPRLLYPPEGLSLRHVGVPVAGRSLLAARAFFKELLRAPPVSVSCMCLGGVEVQLMGHAPLAARGPRLGAFCLEVELPEAPFLRAARTALRLGWDVRRENGRRVRRWVPALQPHKLASSQSVTVADKAGNSLALRKARGAEA